MKRPIGRHLVELLVVALIIAGVAVMIITTDLRATGRAKELLCSGNVHQLTLALTQYTDDHDGRLPLGPDWQMLVQTYAERPEDPKLGLLACPSRPDDPGFGFGLNYDVAARYGDGVGRQVWLIDVRNGSRETWWANDIRFRRLPHNRVPVVPHRGRATVGRGDGSVRTMDPLRLTANDWLPPADEQTRYQ